MSSARGVLVDTGPIYALLEARDQYHAQARTLFGRLEAEGAAIHLAYPALSEAHRLLLTRTGSAVQRAHERVTALFDFASVRYAVEDDGKAARVTLGRFGDQKITLTDATIAAMAVREGMQVATFDVRHFGLMGAEVYKLEDESA